MKRLIIAVTFVCIGIGLATGGFFSLRSICSEMEEKLYSVIDICEKEDKQSAIQSCEDVQTTWHKKNSLLGVYTNHSEMDELQILMKDLVRLAQEEQYDALIDASYTCIYHFEHINESEKPALGNIF